MRARETVEGLVVVAIAAALTAVMTYPLVFRLGGVGRVDTSDGQFSIWNVAWVAHALITDPARVWDANIFHPHAGTLAYAEANLVAGTLAVPAYWLTGNPYAAHNSAVFLGFVLSAAGTYYLMRYLTGSRPAASVGAVLFAFCPFLYARTAHIQLLMTAGLPFSMLATHRLVDRPEPGRAVVLGVTLVATALSCGYYGVFAGVIVAFAGLFYLVARGAWRSGSYYLAMACAAAVAVLAIWPFYEPYLRLEGGSQPFRQLEEARDYSANWAAYLASDGLGNGWIKATALAMTGVRWHEVLFPGVTAIALAVTGVVWSVRGSDPSLPAAVGRPQARRGETACLYGLLAALGAWLSFGPDWGLYSLMYRITPIFSLLRAPARFGIVVSLAIAVLAAIGTERLLRGRKRAPVLAAGLCAVACVELLSVPLPLRPVERVPTPYVLLSHLPPGAVAEFPFYYRDVDLHRHASYMLSSTAHWKPLVNGYSDFMPIDFRAMVIPVSSFPALEAFDILHRHGTRYVVFHFDGYDQRSLQKLQDRLRQYDGYLRLLALEGQISLYEIVGWPDKEPN